MTTEIDKLADHLRNRQAEVHGDRSGAAEDRQDRDFAQGRRDAEPAAATARWIEISPDGKYLYQFGEKIVILNTDDFKVVDRIDLAKPDLPAWKTSASAAISIRSTSPAEHMSMFNCSDPIVHNRVFGIARFDLTTRQMDFNPIGRLRPAWRVCR